MHVERFDKFDEWILMEKKKIGVIICVEGTLAQVGLYTSTNDSKIIWKGKILSGPQVGAFLTINQNDVKIVATVVSEKINDQLNSSKSIEFDNRFQKNTVNRILTLKVKGVINKSRYYVTGKYVPMIGNEVSITTQDELDIIFGIDDKSEAINIGETLLEGIKINIPINKIFASHIGIFGNTGSGKSNTLHKLYLELFRTRYRDNILNKSQFFVIDFNGEYASENSFGISKQNKKIFNVNTKEEHSDFRLPIEQEYLFNSDILAALFDAKPATQLPFLRNSLQKFKKLNNNGDDFAKLEIGFLEKLIVDGKSAESDAIDNWISAAREIGIKEEILSCFTVNRVKHDFGDIVIINPKDEDVVKEKQITDKGKDYFKLDELEEKLKDCFNNISPTKKLSCFLEFQKAYVSAWGSTKMEYINPLFYRMKSSLGNLEKVIKVVDDASKEFGALNIVSLVNSNQEMKRLIPMLLSKMIYDKQKRRIFTKKDKKTTHLVIDEAHNILNSLYKNNGDDWQDYRLSIFEEIIKEGRKFGFYLTLASQRPADISPTIMSQIHNYFIHRLVNDKDLKMLENTVSTLDKRAFETIPCLDQGETVISGNAIKIPIIVKVDKESVNRPKSDDIVLTDFWKNN